MLKLAEHILQSKKADFDPSQFVDHYEDAVVDMLKKKQAPTSRMTIAVTHLGTPSPFVPSVTSPHWQDTYDLPTWKFLTGAAQLV
jgi:hypothetical protein